MKKFLVSITHVAASLGICYLFYFLRVNEIDFFSLFGVAMLILVLDIVVVFIIGFQASIITDSLSMPPSEERDNKTAMMTAVLVFSELLVISCLVGIYNNSIMFPITLISGFIVENVKIFVFIGLFGWSIYGIYKFCSTAISMTFGRSSRTQDN